LVALAGALCCADPRPAAAIPDGQWATQLIEKMAAEEGAGLRQRARLSSAQRFRRAALDDHEVAAPRRARRAARGRHALLRGPHRARGAQVASLSREVPKEMAPAPADTTPPAGLVEEPRAAEPAPQIASLGPSPAVPAKPVDLGGELIRWIASPDCLAQPLKRVLAEVAEQFGPLRVNSTCRSKRHNARVGGAPRSYHLTGSAVDFRVNGHAKAVHAFLRAHQRVGGLKHYGGGLFHIDTGPRRTWASRRRA
jgi:hypothetical protein